MKRLLHSVHQFKAKITAPQIDQTEQSEENIDPNVTDKNVSKDNETNEDKMDEDQVDEDEEAPEDESSNTNK